MGDQDGGEAMTAPLTAGEEWRQSWPVVAAAVAGLSLVSIHTYSIGAMLIPMEAEFHWSRASIALSVTISLLSITCFAPIVGLAIDRFGPRRVAIPGVLLYSTAVATLSTVGPSLAHWWALSLFVGMSSVMASAPVWTTGVSATFDRSRALALAVALCGTALSAGLTPLAATYYIEAFGWRHAWIALAATWLVIAFPIIFLCFRTSLDTAARQIKRNDEPLKPGLEVREGLRALAFYKILIGTGAISFATISISVSLIPTLISHGIGAEAAAGIAGLLGVASIMGRVGSGWLMDRYAANIVAATTCLFPVIACSLLLMFPGNVLMATLATFVLGLSIGAELDATAYLASRHLGLRRFGTLFGFIATAMAGGSGLGPMAFNYIYDVTKSYTLGLWIMMPIAALAASMFFSLGRRSPFQREADIAAIA
jgi:MFS family permease